MSVAISVRLFGGMQSTGYSEVLGIAAMRGTSENKSHGRQVNLSQGCTKRCYPRFCPLTTVDNGHKCSTQFEEYESTGTGFASIEGFGQAVSVPGESQSHGGGT